MYKLIEHRLGDGGSVTEGKGYGVVPNPLQIIPQAQEIPPAYRDISTISYWHKFARNLGYDYLFIRDRVTEAAIASLPTMDVYDSPSSISILNGLTVIVGDNSRDEFTAHAGKIAIYIDGWQFYSKIDYAYRLLPKAEKEILARLQIASIHAMSTDFPKEDIYQWASEYHQDAIANRTARIRWVSTYLSSEIPAAVPALIAAIVGSPVGNLYWLYAEMGVKGSEEDKRPLPGILDYFLGRSLFKGKGLIDSPITPLSEDLTLSQLTRSASDYLHLGLKPIEN